MSAPRRVAFVTGAGRGLGFAIASRFARDGLAVVLSDVDEDAARRSSEELAAGGAEVTPLRCDVSSGSSVADAMGFVRDSYGRLDVLVNNAGIAAPRRASEVSDEEWQLLVEVHLNGAFRCCRESVSLLEQSGQGRVVNIASIVAQVEFPLRCSYSAAKAGIEALTRVLAVEWASLGIRVNAVAPGFVPTDQVRSVTSDKLIPLERIRDLVPLGRLGVPEDIASAVAFLASEDASYVTGQILTVDGGLTVSAGHWVPGVLADSVLVG